MKRNKEQETITSYINEWTLFVKNTSTGISDCLFFYSLALPSVLLCLRVKVHEPMGAALWIMTPCYGMKGAVPVLSLLWSLVERQEGVCVVWMCGLNKQCPRRRTKNKTKNRYIHKHTNWAGLKNKTLQLRTLMLYLFAVQLDSSDSWFRALYITDKHFPKHALGLNWTELYNNFWKWRITLPRLETCLASIIVNLGAIVVHWRKYQYPPHQQLKSVRIISFVDRKSHPEGRQ